MENYIHYFLFSAIGYFFGSLTPSIWLVKVLKNIDVRDHGSGHAGTTNTIRQAGWMAGTLVLIADLAKGFIPVWLSMTFSSLEFAPALAGIGAVIGHCWPVFASFRGGMGIATAAGALLALEPLSLAAAVVILVLILLISKHRARATIITAVLLPPVFYFAGFNDNSVLMAVGFAIIILIRFLRDWNRIYNGI